MYRIKQNSANNRTYSAFIKTINCHLYNYCSNNPMRYTDPDGRTVYSYKYGENRYVFSSGCTVFDDFARRGLPALTSEIGGMLANFIGGIIGSGIGEGCVKEIDKVFGFMEIDTGSSTISKINSAVGNISSIAGDLDKIKGLKGSLANTVANIATTAKVIGYFSTIIDVGSPLFNGKQVATDSFIDITLGKSLCSTSHENVSVLYLYAKTRVDDFIKNGDIEINYSWDGGLNGYSYYRSVIDQIKDELLILKSALKE